MNKLSWVVVLVLILGFGAKEIYDNKTSQKIVFINLNEIYEGFTYKKELENKLKNIQETRKNILDSLDLELRVMSGLVDNEKNKLLFESKRREYLVKKREFTEDNEAMTQEYGSKVMKQLNQYVQDFGNENGYTYILGADGNGSIMFADKKQDITKVVLNYLNEKYKGLK